MMNSLVKAVPNVKQYSSYLHDLKKGVKPIMLSGLTDAAKVHMAFSSRFYTDRPICIITYNEMQAKKMIKDLQEEFSNDGRVIIRPSGTEPLIRVMIEGKDKEEISLKANILASLIEEKLN